MKITDASFQAFRGAFVPKIQPLQISFVRLSVDWPRSGEALLFCSRELDLDLINNRFDNFALQLHEVLGFAFVVLGPQVTVIAGVDELHCDTHLVS